MDTPTQPLYLLQITDPHLKASEDGELMGMRTHDSLNAVLAHVRAHHPEPDGVLATGDLSQDGSLTSYKHFQARMGQFACPVYWLAGNHDNVAVMQRLIGGTPAAQKRLISHGWQLLFLDSSVPDRVHGMLSDSELAFLDQSLAEYPDHHALVCLHHHPVPISARWMNAIGLRNPQALFDCLAGHPQVRGLLWGHIHQQLDEVHRGLRLMATPSTCVQFRPGSEQFSLDDRPPGYRWLRLYPDGHIDTAVERIAPGNFGLDLKSGGY
ncbi:MAG: 3',5'-cyclic-AMP phosphodiesterase [Halomonadaceae bacterium]|nr:MAG: 3',5'-cyclic-AMP phosphodiesterase [Halomonadaceae bacterium]